jgi:hypothetical protein
VKFAGVEAAQQLLRLPGAPGGIETEFLFLGRGSKGDVSLRPTNDATPQKQQALLVVLDRERRPVAAGNLTILQFSVK